MLHGRSRVDQSLIRAKKGGAYDTPFEAPSVDTVLWRYMEIPRFISLLEKRALFFSTPKNLGDPYEGSWTNPMTRMYSSPRNLQKRGGYWHVVDPDTGLSEKIGSGHSKPNVQFRLRELHMVLFANPLRPTFVNCWCGSEYESEAMWKIYSRGSGVAIKSDVASLLYSFSDVLPGHLIVVNYLDYNKDIFPTFNVLSYLSYKRLSFSHEQ